MPNTENPTETFKPGLEGVVAAETKLSHVDGLQGVLVIAGYPLEELAGNATFEEAVYLLWNGALPNRAQLDTFRADLAARRELPQATLDLLAATATERRPTMDALRIAAGTLDLGGDPIANGQGDKALAGQVLARIPTVIAAYWRLLQGEQPITPDPDLSHAANYLYMLTGKRPSDAETRGLETYLNTVIDHGLNASTFAARVIIATRSDLVSAITGAIGALKGPLHGGAPGPALDMVFEIGTPDRAEAYLRAKLDRGERLMGFGHRVYKVRDPRADMLAAAAERMFAASDNMDLYNLAKSVEQTALRLLEEYKPGRNLQTNVEFFTALVLHGLDLSTDLFTPTFAMGRAAGWIAHCFEQLETGRIIRPSSRYIGRMDGTWTPIDQR